MPHAGLAQALRLVSLLVLVLQSQVLICLFISIVFIGGFESVGSWHSCVLSVLSLHEWNKVRIIRRKELTVVFIPPPGSSGSCLRRLCITWPSELLSTAPLTVGVFRHPAGNTRTHVCTCASATHTAQGEDRPLCWGPGLEG